jgi:hypothetical protein
MLRKTVNKLYKKILSLGCGYFILALGISVSFASKGHPWTSEENKQLNSVVDRLGPINWEGIAGEMPNRNAEECRMQWLSPTSRIPQAQQVSGLKLPCETILDLQGFKVNDAPGFEENLCGYSALWVACRINNEIDPEKGGSLTVNYNEVRQFTEDLGGTIGVPLDVDHLGTIARYLGRRIILETETSLSNTATPNIQHDTCEFNTSAPGEPFRLYLSVTPNGGHYQNIIRENVIVDYEDDREDDRPISILDNSL